MKNNFVLVVLLGDSKRITGYKKIHSEALEGDNVINLTKTGKLRNQIEFIINDESLAKKKDTILLELNEYYPETVDEIVNEVNNLDVGIKFLMVIDRNNMSPNDQAVYDRIKEVFGVSDVEVKKDTFESLDRTPLSQQFLVFPNNLITNITNLNQLVDSMRFYYGVDDTEDLSTSSVPEEVKNLLESSFTLIASKIVKDIENIDE